MTLALPDKWIWDSWYVHDTHHWHAFFLQADKSLGDPELRHSHVSVGHATSPDLANWTHLGTCFEPAPSPAWDDRTTWTGSVVRGDDDVWHLFYTGTSRADGGHYQRIGHAVSDDLHHWRRVGDAPVVDRDDPYEEYDPQVWHDRAFRDPWVMRDPAGQGWLMFFTSRRKDIADPLTAGAIGLATSPDLHAWTLQDPVFTGAAGHLEVPQVFRSGSRWFCLFCTSAPFWAESSRALLPEPLTGTHYLVSDDPRGPWQLGPGPMLDGADPARRYAARVVEEDSTLKLLGFTWFDEPGGSFVGEIGKPEVLTATPEGRLCLSGSVGTRRDRKWQTSS